MVVSLRYNQNGIVKNSILGDGCVVDGVVVNSIIGCGVTIERQASIENSVTPICFKR